MSHIFISYSTLNADYAYKLADKLRDEGFDVWIDNAELRSSDNWWEEIVQALQTASAIVPVMTSQSRDSRWVQREIALADEWGIKPFPLLLEGRNFEIYVLTQYTDVSGGSLPPDSFYADLEQAVTRQSERGKNLVGELGPPPKRRRMMQAIAVLIAIIAIAIAAFVIINLNSIPTATLTTRGVRTILRVEASGEGENATIITRVDRNISLTAVAYTETDDAIWYLVEIPVREGNYGWVRENSVSVPSDVELLPFDQIANAESRFPIPPATIPSAFIISRGVATPLRSEPSSVGRDTTLVTRIERNISLLAVAFTNSDGAVWYLVEIPGRDGEYAWVRESVVEVDSDADLLLAFSLFPENSFAIAIP